MSTPQTTTARDTVPDTTLTDPGTAPAARPEPVPTARFDEIFAAVSRWGRYPDPARGAFAEVGPDQVRRALGTVREGRVLGLALPWNTVASVDNPRPALHHMTDLGDIEPREPSCHKDFIGIDYHGKSSSHLDALSHIGYHGQLFGGRVARDVIDAAGVSYGSVSDLGPLVARGVLLDLARARGVDWLEPGEPVTAEDLAAAEELAGTRVGPGDAVLLRSGQFARHRALGAWDSDAASAGLHVEAVPWLAQRSIAVLGADGDSDLRPSPVVGVHSPVHVLSLTAMGVPLLDNLDLEELGTACAELGRREFALVLAPLHIPVGTGSPLNPVAIL